MRASAVISFFLLLIGFAAAVKHDETELRAKLMAGYDPYAMPAVPTNVSVRFTVHNIDIDEIEQSMVLDTWISMEWMDPRLVWDEDDYPDIDTLFFAWDQVWRPDLTLYNNAQPEKFDPLGNTLVVVYASGGLTHVPMSLLRASCVLDMTYWPHDVHNCTAKLGSWVHSGLLLDFIPKDDGAEVELEIKEKTKNGNTLTRASWEVLSNKITRNVVYYNCCPEPYIDLSINIIVKRAAPSYNWAVKVPAVAICVLTGILFLLSPGSTEKILMGTFIIMLEVQFLAYTKDVIVHSPAHTPLIVQLMGEQLMLTVICVFISVLIVRMVRDPHSDSLPACMQRPVSLLASCFCLSGYRKQASSAADGPYPRSIKGEELEMAEDRGMVGDSGPRDRMSADQAGWVLLGAILDRFFFFFYTVNLICKMVSFSEIL